MIRIFLILLLLSYPIFGAEQYAEPACILLKQQVVDYESRLGSTSPLFKKSKANFDTYCQNPTVTEQKENIILTNFQTPTRTQPIYIQQKQQTTAEIKPVAPYNNLEPKASDEPEARSSGLIWSLLKMITTLLVAFSVLIVFLRHFNTKKLFDTKDNNKIISRPNRFPSPNSNYSYEPSSPRRETMTASSSKGLAGEMEVNQGLHLKLDKSVYTNHADVTLPLEDGGTTQVDHIVVSDFGIFVIETKNMTGWIFGNENQKKWTQTIHRSKHAFQNPLRQNYMHTQTLANLLDLPHEYFQSLVVFTSNAELKTRMPKNVGYLDEMLNYILSFDKTVLTEISKTEVSALIEKIKLTSGHTTNRDHVEYLNERHN